MSAEKNIYTHLHLRGNELRGFVFERLESDPDPIDGRIYYNVAKNEFRACISGVWVNIFSIWHVDDDGNITTDKQVIIKNNLIVEDDTSSGGEGEDTPSAGLDETRLQEYLDEHKYVTEGDIAGLIPSNIATVDYVNSKFNSIDLSSYATTTELNALAKRVVPIETWMDNVGQHITYDAELDAIVINHNLIVTKDTSSGGEGEDTPASGIRGIYVNGVSYTDTDGDGFIDLGTISGGGGTADLSDYYTMSQSDAKYLALSGGTINGNLAITGKITIPSWYFLVEDNNIGLYNNTNTKVFAISQGGSLSVRGLYVGSYIYETSELGIVTSSGVNYLEVDNKGILKYKGVNSDTYYDIIHSGNIRSYALPLSGEVVDSMFILKNNTPIYSKYANNSTKAILGIDGSNNVILGWEAASGGSSTYIDGVTVHLRYGTSRTNGLLLNSSGNVLIGTTTDSGYKLQVSGDIYASQYVRANYALITNGEYGIWKGSSYSSVRTSNDLVYNAVTHDFRGAVTMSSTLTVGSHILAASANTSHIGEFTTYFRIAYINTISSGDKANNMWLVGGNNSTTTGIQFARNSDGSTGGKIGSWDATGLYPATNNAYTLGTNSNMWKVVYTPLLQSAGGLDIVANGGGTASRLWLTTNCFRPWGADAGLIDLGASTIRWRNVYANAYYVGPNKSYISTSANYLDLVSYGNEMCIGTSSNSGDIHINYRKSSSGYSPSTYYWRAGSSSSYADFYLGNLVAVGDTSSGSDIRFKDVIKNKTLNIEDIAKAPLFTFKWNNRSDDTVHLGSSAQYWEKVCPWLVSGSDFKSLNYGVGAMGGVISLARHDLQQDKKIKAQGKEIKALKRTVKVLKKEIKRLKEEMRYGDR